MNIHIEHELGYFRLVADDGRDILIQTDYDLPGIASFFGYVPCKSGRTDGTVDCSCGCGKTVGDMIAEADAFLCEIADSETEAEDPGYFD